MNWGQKKKKSESLIRHITSSQKRAAPIHYYGNPYQKHTRRKDLFVLVRGVMILFDGSGEAGAGLRQVQGY